MKKNILCSMILMTSIIFTSNSQSTTVTEQNKVACNNHASSLKKLDLILKTHIRIHVQTDRPLTSQLVAMRAALFPEIRRDAYEFHRKIISLNSKFINYLKENAPKILKQYAIHEQKVKEQWEILDSNARKKLAAHVTMLFEQMDTLSPLFDHSPLSKTDILQIKNLLSRLIALAENPHENLEQTYSKYIQTFKDKSAQLTSEEIDEIYHCHRVYLKSIALNLFRAAIPLPLDSIKLLRNRLFNQDFFMGPL